MPFWNSILGSGKATPTVSADQIPFERATVESTVATNLQAGDRIAGRYRIREILGGEGRSGFGVVYVADDLDSGGVLALKTFQDKFWGQARIADQFKREASA